MFNFCFLEMICRKEIQKLQATTRKKTNQGTSRECWAGTCWAKLSSCRKRETDWGKRIYISESRCFNFKCVNREFGPRTLVTDGEQMDIKGTILK